MLAAALLTLTNIVCMCIDKICVHTRAASVNRAGECWDLSGAAVAMALAALAVVEPRLQKTLGRAVVRVVLQGRGGSVK
jgi:hypothetical protein